MGTKATPGVRTGRGRQPYPRRRRKVCVQRRSHYRLGGNEKEGHKYISELLGKETLDTNTYGQTKGRNGSYSTNYQQTGRELFTPDEIRLLDNRKAILFVRGERPMLDDKYNLKKHPNVKWTEDGGAPPYDYAKAPRSHDDLNIDIERLDDYELLCEEDILGKEQPF